MQHGDETASAILTQIEKHLSLSPVSIRILEVLKIRSRIYKPIFITMTCVKYELMMVFISRCQQKSHFIVFVKEIKRVQLTFPNHLASYSTNSTAHCSMKRTRATSYTCLHTYLKIKYFSDPHLSTYDKQRRQLKIHIKENYYMNQESIRYTVAIDCKLQVC